MYKKPFVLSWSNISDRLICLSIDSATSALLFVGDRRSLLASIEVWLSSSSTSLSNKMAISICFFPFHHHHHHQWRDILVVNMNSCRLSYLTFGICHWYGHLWLTICRWFSPSIVFVVLSPWPAVIIPTIKHTEHQCTRRHTKLKENRKTSSKDDPLMTRGAKDPSREHCPMFSSLVVVGSIGPVSNSD